MWLTAAPVEIRRRGETEIEAASLKDEAGPPIKERRRGLGKRLSNTVLVVSGGGSAGNESFGGFSCLELLP